MTAKQMTRTEIEKKARAYLRRAQTVENGRTTKHAVTGADFDQIVEREVAETEKQSRALGTQILD
jgi:hypothetical protein